MSTRPTGAEGGGMRTVRTVLPTAFGNDARRYPTASPGGMSGRPPVWHRYRRVRDLGRDLFAVAMRPRALLRLLRGRAVGPAFRERLMLIVSGVHVCPYCIRLHGSLARRAGVSRAEVDGLLEGLVGDAPPAELGALEYALHWAESGGRPEAGSRRELEQRYGTKPPRRSTRRSG